MKLKCPLGVLYILFPGFIYAVLNMYIPFIQAVGSALLWTLEYCLKEKFNDQARSAWTTILGILTGNMLLGVRSGR